MQQLGIFPKLSKKPLTRNQALDAYRRVREWEQRQSAKLREAILVRYFDGSDLIRHNRMISYERGQKLITKEAYEAGKRYLYEQQRIWDAAQRLQKHFGQFF